MTEITELGFSFTPFEAEPVELKPVVLFDPAERTTLSLTALAELGIAPNHTDEMKAADLTVEQYYAGLFKSFHDELVEAGGFEYASIEPMIGITLDDERLTFAALGTAFDAKEGQAETSIGHTIWGQLSADQINSREIGGDSIIRSGLRIQAMLLGGRTNLDDGGLYHTKMRDVTDDHGKGSEQAEAAAGQLLVNPADNVVLNAQRRVEGRKLLSTEGWHRFVQIEKQSADGSLWRPDGDADGGQPRFGGSGGVAGPDVGVRRLVEKKA